MKSTLNVSPKKRFTAVLLGFFLGGLGIHNFYLGKIKRGIIQLSIFILGIVLFLTGYLGFGVQVASAVDKSDPGCIAMFTIMMVGILAMVSMGTWALVEWIFIACGKGTDKNNQAIKNW